MTYPTIRPELTLDFANSRQLDPRISFSRSSWATYLNPDTGLIAPAQQHKARFEKEGLLMEESRTNYCKNYSDYFNAYENCTKASGLSPAGDNTAQVITLIAEDYTVLRAAGQKPTNIPTNSVGITSSLYVKGSYSAFRLSLFNGATRQKVTFQNFNTDSWTVSVDTEVPYPASNFQVEDVGNGWYRLSFYASNYTAAMAIGLWANSDILPAGDTYSVWLPQIEIGKFPTSAIPTEVASEVTRAGDIATISSTNLSSWYNPNSSTIVSSQIDIGVGDNSYGVVWGFGTGGANRIELRQTGLNLRRAFYINRDNSSSGVAPLVYTKTSNSQRYTVGVAINAEGADYAAEGVGVTGDTFADATMPIINTVYIAHGAAPDIASKTIARISYYNERLSDVQLQSITS